LERPHDEAVDGERHEQRLSLSALGYAFSVQRWDLLDLDAPEGTRDPIVLHSDDGARAILIVLSPGQSLGEHQVKENAWITVLEGEVEISAGAETIAVGPGTLTRFEPDERHSLRTDAGARVLMLLAPWPGAGHYRGSD
jgi:quercetin dioxygenase-like cupin family protein